MAKWEICDECEHVVDTEDSARPYVEFSDGSQIHVGYYEEQKAREEKKKAS
jgi:hypothetical protein